MSVNSEIYAALAPLLPDGDVFDTTVDDQFMFTDMRDTIIVFQEISDVPEIPIDGVIIGRMQQWQVSVRSTDITKARAFKETVISTLHGLEISGGRCDYDNCPGVIVEDIVPREYHYPITFTVSI